MVDLDEIYKKSVSTGTIIEDTQKSGGVNLDAIYKNSKSGELVAQEKQRVPQPKQSILGKVGGQLQQALMNTALKPDMAMLGISGPGYQMFNELKNQGLGINPERGPVDSLLNQATDPRTYGAAMLGIESAGKIPKIKIGGEHAMKKVAIQTADDMASVDRQFQAGYQKVITDKLVPETLKTRLSTRVSDELVKTAPDTPINSYVDDLTQTFRKANLTMRDLHNLKGEIFKRMKYAPGTAKNALSKIYDEMNGVLSERSMGGKAYANITQNRRTFFVKVEKYLDKLIRDTEGNITGRKLSSEGVRKKGLSLEQKKAFQTLARFANRADISPEVAAMVRGERVMEIARKLIPVGGVATGAGYLGYRLIKPFTEK